MPVPPTPAHLFVPVALIFVACTPEVEEPSLPATPDVAFDADAMMSDLSYLADPAFDGREPGSEGDYAARDLIADRFAALGLEAYDGADNYEQPFITYDDIDTANVIGFVRGTSATVGAEVIVISAHFDHLGNGKLGANDNASGVSGLLSIAQAVAEGDPPERTILFAAFGAEESGFEGSYAYIEAPDGDPGPADVVYNLNLDMIGSYDQKGIVYALGAVQGTLARDLLAATDTDLDVGLDDVSDQSDNAVFCEAGVPYVFFWTADPACYHKKCDTIDKIDADGLVSISELVHGLADDLARSTEDLRSGVKAGVNVCDG
jgi:hypothetical protein